MDRGAWRATVHGATESVLSTALSTNIKGRNPILPKLRSHLLFGYDPFTCERLLSL